MLKKRFLGKLTLLAGIVLVFTMTGCGGGGAGGGGNYGGGGGGNGNNGLPALTGTVSITGTATVGQTLTANIDAIGGSGTISYQWRRGGTNIGTNSNAYTVQTADIGFSITVTVTRSGNSGNITSTPTSLVVGGSSDPETITITNVAINVTGPAKGQIPDTIASGGTGNFTVGAVTWNPSHNPFEGSTVYTVTVTLTASVNHTFAGLSSASINGNAATIPSNTGNTVTLSYTFAPTLDKDVAGITILSFPANPLTYTHGDLLDLSGLVVRITYTDTSTEDVDHADFASKTIGANPSHNQQLIRSTHSNLPVVISLGSHSANTGNLIVSQRNLNINGFNITRAFNGTTAGSVNFGTLSFNGLASGETASVNTSGVTAAYAGTLVGTHNITFSGSFTMIGGNAIPSNYIITEPTGVSGVITPASPTAPNPPGLGAVTQTSVTLTAPTGGHILHPHLPVIEYARSAPGGTTPFTTWQTGLSFSGLSAGTTYRFFARYGNDVQRNIASSASTGLQVTTLQSIVSHSGAGVIRIPFSGEETTVNFNNLSGNDIFLVKVNTSASAVTAANTGSVANIIPSLSQGRMLSNLSGNESGIVSHTRSAEYNANSIPISVSQRSLLRQANFVAPIVGDIRNLHIETSFDSGTFTLQSATLLATGNHSNIWVMNNSISTTHAQNLADKFDDIYLPTVNLLGYEFGGRPGHPVPGGRDGDPKVQILVYDFGIDGVVGFFWGKDHNDFGVQGSNQAEIFYINSRWFSGQINIDAVYTTLIHEFQHMIHFNVKRIENSMQQSPAWYNEILSMMAEDVIADFIGITPSNQRHVIRGRIPRLIAGYTVGGIPFAGYSVEGITEWGGTLESYSTKYGFGAYLLRNYGGAELLRRIMANNQVGIASITAALNEIQPGLTFNEALLRYGEAIIFNSPMPAGVMSFDKTVQNIINGIPYTAHGFDIWSIARASSVVTGPFIVDLVQRNMRPHSITIHQAAGTEWRNRSGSYSITLQRPSNPNIELILMVK